MNYENKINKTVQNIPPSGIRKFFDIASTIKDAISLGVGEPDFITPDYIREAGIKSIKEGKTAYTSNQGEYALRVAISDYLETRFEVSYRPDTEIFITVGASEAIDLSLRAIINPGEEVLLTDPGYVSYAPNITLVGGVPKPIKTIFENNFKLTPEALEKAITKKTKAIILSYPCNPTGAIMTKSELQVLIPIIKKHDLLVIADEIYAELTYSGIHTSVASLEDMKNRTIYISGFSKAFAMTGWRIGYVGAPKEIMDAMVKMHQYTIMSAPTVGQYAAIAALEEGKKEEFITVKKMRDSYNERRVFVIDSFNRLGLTCNSAEGAFYAFPSVKSTDLTGDNFAERLLLTQKVAVVPGSGFGAEGLNYIRACYATSMQNLKTAVQKVESFLYDLKRL
ncbi:MAG: aminotransferase class I/II-fold pyridoxal phosphate-dependent enzyme [Defluviitaleaceae bacterium]|nr:aminotransferase class I/II-fold pyridoxal phosphate-dependent enzyme [Defluviitaleaceae bacterium]